MRARGALPQGGVCGWRWGRAASGTLKHRGGRPGASGGAVAAVPRPPAAPCGLRPHTPAAGFVPQQLPCARPLFPSFKARVDVGLLSAGFAGPSGGTWPPRSGSCRAVPLCLCTPRSAPPCAEPQGLWGTDPKGSLLPLLLLTRLPGPWSRPPNPALPHLAGSVLASTPPGFGRHSFWLIIFLHFLVSLWHPFQQ